MVEQVEDEAVVDEIKKEERMDSWTGVDDNLGEDEADDCVDADYW